MAYQEVNPSMWIPQNSEDFIEGVLVRVQENVGANESMLYSIETPEGVKNVWGSAILDEKMSLIDIGEKVKIVYKGKSEKKQAGKNPAKIFQVFRDVQQNEAKLLENEKEIQDY